MNTAQKLGILERVILGLIVVTLCVAFAPAAMRAEVTRVEITSKQDVLGGKSFGTVGAYEKLTSAKSTSRSIPIIRTTKLSSISTKRRRTRRARWNSPRTFSSSGRKIPRKGNGVRDLRHSEPRR